MFNLSQEEFDDEDDWNPCKAAGVCLMLIAQCCEDDILTYVIDFITANIEREDWKSKDAAVMAFGEFKSFHIHLATKCVHITQEPDRTWSQTWHFLSSEI